MQLQEPKNPNYAATVVRLKHFAELPNCDNLKAALIFGCSVIVSKDAKEGDLGLFFPVETQLDAEFVANNNLFRKPEWGNIDPSAKGYFEQSRRVKAVKFRGNKSEGFFMPVESLRYTGFDVDALLVDEVFDALEVGGTVHSICRKYIPRRNLGKLRPAQARQAKLIDQIVPNQFHFHGDTEQLRRNLHKIHPSDVISISDKWHGTSVVISKILTVRNLTWYEKLAQFFGVRVQTTEYGLVYSSRKVVKSVNGTSKHNNHFYTEDIWGVIAKEVADRVPNGYTLYGEIVGYTPDGSPIQGGYHYGCPVGGHKFLVYRVTLTNRDGVVLELSWPQMFDFCAKYGFEMVKELYYGKAGHLIESWPPATLRLQNGEDWESVFLSALEDMFVPDKMCEHNNFEVPAEGVVVRIDHLNEAEAFKLKAFAFLERESKSLDKGELDIETAESEEETITTQEEAA